jgi:hypothetical protein
MRHYTISLFHWNIMITQLVHGENKTFRLILQGDFGKDPDDVFALLNCHKEVDCIIANLYESKLRARLAKSVLRDLGDTKTLVYTGSNIGKGIIKIADYEFDYPNLVSEDEIIVDSNPYHTILQDGTPSVLIINSAMTDLANFFIDYYDPTVHNIHTIVMQGGYEQDDKGYLSPNCAANNAYDHYSAQICYDYIQEYDLPFVVITKQIAYDNPIPANFYNELNCRHEHSPVTRYLENVRLQSLQDMYKLAILPANDPNRQGFPNDRDAEWFFKNIAKKPFPAILPEANKIDSYILSIVVYDMFTILYAIQYQPYHVFDHIPVKNKFCEAVAKPNINYANLIINNSVRSLE